MSSKINPINVGDEIDLLSLLKIIWKNRIKIFVSLSIFFFFGVLVSLLQTSKEYKSVSTFLLKSGGSQSATGPMGGLAALAGVSLPSGGTTSTTEIPPSLYPTIISSIEFKKALINAPLKVAGFNKEVTYAYYYENLIKPSRFDLFKLYTLGLPRLLINRIKNTFYLGRKDQNDKSASNKKIFYDPNILSLSANETTHFARLNNQLKIESKNGLFILSFVMEDPFLAAQMAHFSLELLQKEVVAYKLANLREELRFTEILYEEKKQSFKQIQNELGDFRDRNQNVVASFVQNQFDRLQAEYNLRLNVVTQIANSLESTKIQIARNTPIFSILDPVTIPSSPNPQNRLSVIVIFSAIGFILTFSYVFGVEFLKGFSKKWNDRIA